MAKEINKAVIYQLLPRLFGNKVSQYVPWADIVQNGIGKMADIDALALEAIKKLGVSHIWYTGILQHAKVTDYSEVGINADHPDIVKGRAGSPYAVKDYFSIDPDLATDPANRMQEFEDLVKRSHDAGLKVIIDIIPNHVARNYNSQNCPEGHISFGEKDDPGVEYAKNNDFYYIPGEQYINPDWTAGKKPLGGEQVDMEAYFEYPAKWTGNGSRRSQPDINDWYETVKINYGVKPDGSYDFPVLPGHIREGHIDEHFKFWENKELPSSWEKWRDIVSFWMDKGVDGFRYDMAELVPLEFWSYLNSYIKSRDKEFLLIAEVYEPARMHDFIHVGKMDLLYDKVDLYDTLRDIITGQKNCHTIFPITDKYYPIRDHLLHFLENHDEQRIASPDFANDPFAALPALVLSSLVDTGAIMIYFGQEVGEKAKEEPGFGSGSRTSIFDYIGVPAHQRWMNKGKFDGGLLTTRERELRKYYMTLMNFVAKSSALKSSFYDLHRHNAEQNEAYPGEKVYSFARYSDIENLLIISNFDARKSYSFRFSIYPDLIERWRLQKGEHIFKDLFSGKFFTMYVQNGFSYIELTIKALESLVLTYQAKK